MPTTELDVIRWGPEGIRTGTWRGDDQIGYLAPVPGAPPPSGALVRHACRSLAARGYRSALTAALAADEQRGFLEAGFEVEERLHLLVHDPRQVEAPGAPAGALRRGRSSDRAAVLDVDARAFPAFWRLDAAGLEEALRATPFVRFRVAVGPDDRRRVAGYAVTGRAGRRGYLQRLAVDPAHQRSGLGRVLVLDALRWLRRWRVERAVVNTQVDNRGALALYESLGFRREPAGLTVLRAELAP